MAPCRPAPLTAHSSPPMHSTPLRAFTLLAVLLPLLCCLCSRVCVQALQIRAALRPQDLTSLRSTVGAGLADWRPRHPARPHAHRPRRRAPRPERVDAGAAAPAHRRVSERVHRHGLNLCRMGLYRCAHVCGARGAQYLRGRAWKPHARVRSRLFMWLLFRSFWSLRKGVYINRT